MHFRKTFEGLVESGRKALQIFSRFTAAVLEHQIQRRAVVGCFSTHQETPTRPKRPGCQPVAQLSYAAFRCSVLPATEPRGSRCVVTMVASLPMTHGSFLCLSIASRLLTKHMLSEPHRSPPVAACSSILRPSPSNFSSIVVTFASDSQRAHGKKNRHIQYLRQSAFCSSVPRNVKSTFVISSKPSSSCGSR